jgi:polyferredoxin
MDKQQWPRGLIRYTSEHELAGEKTQFLKLRTVGYGLATLLATAYLVWMISSTKQLELSIVQVRNPLFVTLSDGSIRNSYEVKINNKTMAPAKYKLEIEGLDGAHLSLGNVTDLSVKPDTSLRLFAQVNYMPPAAGNFAKNREFAFKLTPIEGEVTQSEVVISHFMLP